MAQATTTGGFATRSFDEATYAKFGYWMHEFYIVRGRAGFTPSLADLCNSPKCFDLHTAQYHLREMARQSSFRSVGPEIIEPFSSEEANRIVNGGGIEFAIFVTSKLDSSPRRLSEIEAAQATTERTTLDCGDAGMVSMDGLPTDCRECQP